MSSFAKALAAVTNFSTRWRQGIALKKNRVLDDRDKALGEALLEMEQHSDEVYPAVLSLSDDLTGLDTSALTGLVITGTNFVADTEFASGISDEGSGTKELTWTRTVPGDDDITVTIVSSGVANHTVTAAWDIGTKTLTVTRGTLATAAETVTAITAAAASKHIVTVAATGAASTGVPTAGSTTLTGGSGVLPVLNIGDVALDGSSTGNGITAWTDTTITFDCDASVFVAGEGQLLRLWVNDAYVAAIALVAAAGSISTSEIADGAVTTDKLATKIAMVDLTSGVQAGAVLPITVNITDMEGDALGRVQRCVATVYTADMLQGLVGVYTLAETGTGTEISTTAKPTLLFDTDASGDAVIGITDVGGAGISGFLEVRPVSTSTNVPGHARIIAFVIA